MRRTLVQCSGCAQWSCVPNCLFQFAGQTAKILLCAAVVFVVAGRGMVMAQVLPIVNGSGNVRRNVEDTENTLVNTGVHMTNNFILANNGDVTAGYSLTNQSAGVIRNTGNIVVGYQSNLATPSYDLNNSGHIHVADSNTVTIYNGVVNNTGNTENTGTFSGFGRIKGRDNTGTIFNNTAGGLIAPGFTDGITKWYTGDDEMGTFTIQGNLNNIGGDFNIKIDGNDNDKVDVTGDAVINDGKVRVNAVLDDGDVYDVTKQYVFLTAGNLEVDRKLVVDGKVGAYTFYGDYDENDYWLQMKLARNYAFPGQTFNQRAVGRYINGLGNSDVVVGSDFDDVLQELDGLSDAETLVALDQMGGAIYGTLANSSITNTNRTNSTLHDILRRDAFGPSCGTNYADACAPACGTASGQSGPFCRNAWGVVYGTGGHTRYDGNAYGYDQSFVGGMVGLDKRFGHCTRAGFYTSYGEGRISSNLLERSKSKELQVGLYLRKEMLIGYMLLSGGLGYNQYDTERTISFMNRRATNRHNGIVGTVYGERGLEIQGALAKWQPFLGLQYIGNQQQGFTETGAGSLNLTGDITTGNSFRSLFGTRLSSDLARTHRGTLALFGQAYWMHEFLNPTYAAFTAQFGGAPSATKFTVHGNDAARDWAVLGTGLTYDRRNWRLFAGYDISMNKQQVLHAGNAGFVYGW